MRALPLLLMLPLLAGCELVDQRTVARWLGGRPEAPSAAALAQADLPALPLVTIRYDHPEEDPAPVLEQAAGDALERKPDAVFDVVTPVPTSAPKAEQEAYIRQGAADARAVADMLGEAGVPPNQLRLELRGDPGRPAREVRVYVR